MEIIEKGKNLTHRNDILAENRPYSEAENARLWNLMLPREEASVITVACRPEDFSASGIAHAVEDSNAHLLNMNVTSTVLDDGRLTVELRTSLRNTEATVRFLLRYGYEVTAASSFPAEGSDGAEFSDSMRSRAAELIHILEL